MVEQPQEEGLHLREYLQVVRKRLLLVLVIVIIGTAHTLSTSMRVKPMYRASSQILIERFSPQVVNVQTVKSEDSYARDYYPTQYKLLKSRAIAREVIQKLQLHRHEAFNPKPEKKLIQFNVRQAVASVVRAVLPKKPTEGGVPQDMEREDENDPLTPYIGRYLGMLRIEPVEESRLVNITFVGPDPMVVAQMANAHAETYIARDLKLKRAAAEDALGWLETRLEEFKGKLRTSEEALQEFQEKEDIVALESILSGSGNNEESLLAQKLAELSSALTGARTERISLETVHHQLQNLANDPRVGESIPQVIENGLIQSLKGNYIALSQQYSELRVKYGEKHPKMVALRRELDSLQSRMKEEVKKVAQSVELQYEMLLAREKNLEQALENAKSDIRGLNKKAVQYGVLKREVGSNRQIYDLVLRRAKETTLTKGLKSTNIFIVDRAEGPGGTVRPPVRKNVLMAMVISMMIGVGLAIFLDHLDNTMHTPGDVKRYLGVPFLGPVGLLPKKKQKGRSTSADLVALQEPKCSLSEALRNIRTNLVFSFVEPDQKAMVITSPGPMEGKTFICSNMATTIARMGRPVLLVDADMRKPTVHKLFDTSLKPGLSDVIAGRCTLEEAMRETAIEHLKVIPAGTIPPNPAELLTSNTMRNLIATFRERFDYLIFDTPPILAVTEATVLSGVLDGTVLIVKASETTRESAQRALEQLNDVRARVLGVILNQVNFKKDRYYYNYYYASQYYYTNDGEKRVRRTRKSRKAKRPYYSAGGYY
jgi:capsular exopolysaccharide synthesis family protein